MRSCYVNEAKEDKLQVFEGNKRRGIFVLIGSFIVPFKRWVIFVNMGGYFDPINQITLLFYLLNTISDFVFLLNRIFYSINLRSFIISNIFFLKLQEIIKNINNIL